MLSLTLNSQAQLNPSSDSDSIKISSKAARNMLIRAQQAAILEDEVKTLNERIIEKERQLAITNTRDSLLIVSLNKEIFIMKDQRGIFEMELKVVNKQLRKERTKTRLVGLAGIITTLAGVLLIK